MPTSKAWRVYLPTGAGADACFAPLRTGDVIDLVDNELGPLQTRYRRNPDTNRPEEVARFRAAEPSELVIQVTEEAAEGVDELRAGDCPLPVQRRLCPAGGGWDLVEHYGLVQYGQRGSSSLTANGTDARDDIPTIQFPGTYASGQRYVWNKQPVRDYDKGSGANNAPVGIVYCDDADCPDCSNGCQRLFALFTNGTDEFTLETSNDGGQTWAAVTTGLSAAAGYLIFCYHGRLFLGLDDELFYSDTPLVSGSWVEADTAELAIVGLSFRQMLYPVGSLKVLYLLYHGSGGFANGVARSRDNGETWEVVKAPAAGITSYQIAAAGTWLATVGVQGVNAHLFYSDDMGDSFASMTFTFGADTDGLSIAMELPNPLFPRHVVVYILARASTEHRLYKFHGRNIATFSAWSEKWRQVLATSVLAFGQFVLYTAASGYLVWLGLLNQTANIVYIFKSPDGGCTWATLTKTSITADPAFGVKMAVCPRNGNRAILLGGEVPEE